MEIKLHEITIRDVVKDYRDNAENGVIGYGGKLNIRPAFQREFVYKEKQRNAVIETIIKGFPLNVMYWSKTNDGNFELLDGQQRTISFCQYVNGDFSINDKYFHNLTQTEKNQILDYKLFIYICDGNDKEKLDWFKVINIAGVKLTDQELRNAVYTGQWLTDAKKWFSMSNCPAYHLGNKYILGDVIRQDYLEIVLKWLSAKENKSISAYMSEHQGNAHATPLWQYFQSVINWVQTIFPNYRKEMKGVEWGLLYNKYGERSYNPQELENEVLRLMQDDEVTKRSGIYSYLLSGDNKYLNLRAFTDNQKRVVYEKQKGICPICVKESKVKCHYEFEEMEGDHIVPWSKGGKTVIENCQMLCGPHNKQYGNK